MKTILKHLLLVVALFLGSFYPYCTLSQVTETNRTSGDTIYGANPENCKINLSLYIEFYKQKKFKEAYLPWSIVFRECPKSSKNIYIHGTEIVWNKINKTTDASLKLKYGDTLLMIYDQRIKYFGEEGKNLGRKSIDFFKLYPKKKSEALQMMLKSIDLEGSNSDTAIISTFFQIATDLQKEKSVTDEQLLEYYNKTTEIISNQLSNSTDSILTNKLQKVRDNLDITFVGSGVATCDKVVAIFQKKFDANKNDISTLKTIVKILGKQECTDSKVYAEASEQLNKLEQSPLSAVSLAHYFVKSGNYSKAITYYQQATDLEKDNEQKAQYYYEMAVVAGTKLSQLVNARSYAYKALENKKNWGKPYILIGTLYVQSAKDCGENAFFQSMTYIAAVDKFTQARNVDPSCSEEAGKYIATYSSYFPSKEDIFFNKMQEGQSYTVSCWINETIKIKAKLNLK